MYKTRYVTVDIIKKMENSNEVLKSLYYTFREEYGLSGIDKMLKVIKKRKLPISRRHLIGFLRSQNAYVLHYPRKLSMKRKPILAFGIEHNLHMDLADMSSIATANNGIRFLCVLVIHYYTRHINIHTMPFVGRLFEQNDIRA